ASRGAQLLLARRSGRDELEELRVDVAAASDRRRVRQPLGRGCRRFLDLEPTVTSVYPRFDYGHGTNPRAKVLGSNVRAADFAQIVVEARRVDFPHGFLAAVAEQPLSGQLFAAQQDLCQPAVAQPHLDELAGLRFELEPD